MNVLEEIRVICDSEIELHKKLHKLLLEGGFLILENEYRVIKMETYMQNGRITSAFTLRRTQ